MTVTLTTSGSVALYAGKNAEVLIDASYVTFINAAESQLIADTGVNWIDIYGTMNADYKPVVNAAVASLAANSVINYNPNAYPTLASATTMMNVNLERYDRAVAKLKEAAIYKPFGGAQIQS